MKILVAAGVAVIAVAGLASVGYLSAVEIATVNITLPAWKLDSWTTVHGAPSGGQFQTHRAQVTMTETLTGTATGSVSGGANDYASGYVVVSSHCVLPGMTCTVTPAPRGSLVCRTPSLPNPPTTISACYVLLAAANCLCGETVPVRAQYPGPGWNTAARTINAALWNEPYGAAADVTNPAPITGGTNTSIRVVSQADIDSASASVRTQLTMDLQSALQVKLGQAHVISDGAPSMTVTPNLAAGARATTFQVTATGTLGATAFQDSDAQAQIAKSIDRWVPKGFRLNGAPLVTDYQVEDATDAGDVTVSGRAIDYVVPNFSANALRTRLRGAGVDAARTMIETAAPGSRVDIHLSPMAAPMLPLDASRISISVTVRPAA